MLNPDNFFRAVFDCMESIAIKLVIGIVALCVIVAVIARCC